MSANKYIIIFSILLLLPISAKAQRYKSVTERQAEQIGKDIYVTTSNDTTRVVNFISTGLDSPDTQFLKLDRTNAALDSLFMQKVDYTSEEAMLDMNNLIDELEREKREIKGNNDGLSFRLASKKRDLRQKELEAKKIAAAAKKPDSKELSTQELAALYLKYGDQPTYYINEIEVPQSIVNQLRSSDIISKDLRIKGTVSNNPNGEVWITVTEKGLSRIKLPKDQRRQANDDFNQYLEEVRRAERIQEIEGLESIPVVRRETSKDGQPIDTQTSPQQKDSEGVVYSRGTRVLKRTVTNPNESINNRSTEAERIPAKRSPDTVTKGQDNNSNRSNSTPKRSVRRIKAKQAEQYEDGVENQLPQ